MSLPDGAKLSIKELAERCPESETARPDPLQNCDRRDLAFPAPEPGHCRACAPAVLAVQE
jgi:hypothetical protein